MQGTTQSTRIGQRIRVQEILLNYQTWNPSTVLADSLQGVRVMLIEDRMTNGANPAIGNLVTTLSSNALYNLVRANTFRVLYDEVVCPAINYGTNNGSGGLICRRVKVTCNCITDYSLGNAGTVADIDTGGLFVVIWSDLGTTTSPVIRWTTRVVFTDTY